jgi:hypothetical protein
MYITDSSIQFASSHTAVEYAERQESLTVWRQGREPVRTEQHNNEDKHLQHQAEKLAKAAAKVSLSVEAQQKASVARPVAETSEVATTGEDGELMSDLNMRILKALFEKLTGRSFKMYDAAAVQQQAVSQEAAPGEETPAQVPQANAGWGLSYQRREVHHEAETTRFAAQGVVTTADGQQIEIGLELNMSRSFTSMVEESLQLGDAVFKDPLVVNFAGTGAQLTQETFSFDIDADGSEDQIAFVAAGSGFLAMDGNDDGVVNDGSELFGTESGDGFADLAAYDGDGNGWIDEGDDVYSRLRIWSKTAAGEDQLLALGAAGVGAIYLGRIDTPFSVKDASNTLQGQVRATGLFLFEQGGVGTMQQLDLVA